MLIDHPGHQIADFCLGQGIATLHGLLAGKLQDGAAALFHGNSAPLVFQLIQDVAQEVPGLGIAQNHGNAADGNLLLPEGFHRQADALQQLAVFAEQLLFPAGDTHQHGHQQLLSGLMLIIGLHHPVEQQPFMHRVLVDHQQIVLIFHQNEGVERHAHQLHGLGSVRQEGRHLFRIPNRHL